MADETFTVTVEGPGTNISHQVNAELALRILSIGGGGESDVQGSQLSDQGRSYPSSAAPSSQESKDTTSPTSIGEFIESLHISNNYDRIAAIALFMKEEQNQPQVTKGELPDLFQKAGESAPSDLSRDLKLAISNKLMAEDTKTSGSYYVTAKGEKTLRSSE